MADKGLRQPSTTTHFPSRRSFPPFEALRAFDAVAQLGGVRKAARALLRDHAVISRHLRTLETWTGTTLLIRTPRGAVLTKEGREYHEKITKAINVIAYATTDLLKRSEEYSVNVWCMPAFAVHWMMGHLDSFQLKSPDLGIGLRPTRQMPDFHVQEADVVIRMMPISQPTSGLPSNLRSIEFARPPTIPVASPDYLSSHKEIQTPEDLLAHELLHEENFDSWQTWLAACGIQGDLNLSGPRLWQGHMTVAAAKEGRGISLSNCLVTADYLSTGRLIEIGAGNPQFKSQTLWAYHFITRRDKWDARPIQRFRTWLLETVGKEL